MDVFLVLATGAVAVLVGVLVLRSHQRVIGWLLVAHGVSFAVLLSFAGTSSGQSGLVVDQLASGSWVFLFLWLALVAYLLPDGHNASRFWQVWVRAGLAGVVAFLVGSAGDSQGFRDAHGGADPPLPWLPGPVSSLLGVTGLVATVLLLLGSMVAVRARLGRSSGDERLQLLWVVWGATSLPAALALAWTAHFALDDDPLLVHAALLLVGVTLPLSIGVAVLRYRMFDIEVVLSRTLTYGLLVMAVLAVYAALLFCAERLFGDSAVGGLVAVGLVAVAVHPAYSAVRTRIERWVFGYRSDPASALRRLAAGVETADPLHVVDTVTAAVADALKVDAAWVVGPGERVPEDPRVVSVPLVHRGDRLGALAVQVPAGRVLSVGDTALLRDLATQAGVTVRAAQLAAELQASRSRIVAAREEERKRLRRDLHDGVGPALAAILLKLQAARSRTDDDERDALLVEIGAETKDAIKEVRRVVEDLRPPAIDEVGLVGAIRQRALALSSRALTCEVHGPDALPPLAAAVEVAVFRIASEALTNVVRHSGATRCLVDLEVNGALTLTVSDNGRGAARPSDTGVGWTSMVERAKELGGSCSVRPRTEGGLVVHAVLPLMEAVPREAVR